MKKHFLKWMSFALSTVLVLSLLAGCASSKKQGSSGNPSVSADDILTESIAVSKVEGYEYCAEEIMFLSGIVLSGYRPNVKYSLSDLDEDEVSELFVTVDENGTEKSAVYAYDGESGAALRICRYDKDGFYEEPDEALKAKIDEIRNHPENLNWVDGTQWVDASLIGVVNQVGNKGEKTDFYLASNYDWLAESHLRFYGDTKDIITFTEEIKDRQKEMFLDRDKYQGKDIQILRDYYDAATDWEKRNKDGIEPVKKYFETIEKIQSLDDMTAYLSDPEKDPFCRFMKLTTSLDVKNTEYWVLDLGEDDFSILPRDYNTSDAEEVEETRLDFDLPVRALLAGAGYKEDEIDKIMEESYSLENELLDRAWLEEGENEEDSVFYGYQSFDDFTSACKNFPLKEMLNAYGVTKGTLHATYPLYMDYLDEVYKTENLSRLKSYALTHTAFQAYTYLDLDMMGTILRGEESDEEFKEAMNNDYQTYVLNNREALAVAEENAYMTYFVDEEDKKDILALCNEIRDTYREILEGEEWLSEEGKKQALAKLDNMTFSVLKPDTLIDASYLSVDRDVSFLDANAKIVVNTIKHNSEFVGSKRVPGDWRYDIRTEIPSTVQNAFYYGSFNQFFIMSGFIGDTTYRRDMSKEEKLGLLGEVFGHELTHGFDPLGIQYDKDGNMVVTDENPYGWLPKEDYEAFMERADRIAAYFNNINAFPYAKIDGNKVWGEAAADIGGMTITLKIAEKYDDFDYDRYFRCHSELWKEQVTVTSERYDISNEHPLRYLRINAVVQQFDKFNETYDIKEGDPMYLAPEDRIKIW